MSDLDPDTLVTFKITYEGSDYAEHLFGRAGLRDLRFRTREQAQAYAARWLRSLDKDTVGRDLDSRVKNNNPHLRGNACLLETRVVDDKISDYHGSVRRTLLLEWRAFQRVSVEKEVVVDGERYTRRTYENQEVQSWPTQPGTQRVECVIDVDVVERVIHFAPTIPEEQSHE